MTIKKEPFAKYTAEGFHKITKSIQFTCKTSKNVL